MNFDSWLDGITENIRKKNAPPPAAKPQDPNAGCSPNTAVQQAGKVWYVDVENLSEENAKKFIGDLIDRTSKQHKYPCSPGVSITEYD